MAMDAINGAASSGSLPRLRDVLKRSVYSMCKNYEVEGIHISVH